MSDPGFQSELRPESSVASSAGFSDGPPTQDAVMSCSQATSIPPPMSRPVFRCPCDVAQFALSDAQTGVGLSAVGRLRGDALPADVPPHIVDDLKTHDLVLERAVDYVGRRILGTNREMDSPKVKMKLHSSATFEGNCGDSSHPLIEMRPNGAVECEPRSLRSWKASQTDRMELVGRGLRGNFQTTLFSLTPLWAFGELSDSWTVTAIACGIPANGPARTSLNALVRIYCHDEYELTFSWPAMRSYASERSAGVSVTGARVTKSSSTVKEWGNVTSSRQTSNSVSSYLEPDLKYSESKSSSQRVGDTLYSTSHSSSQSGLKGSTETYTASGERDTKAFGGLLLVRSKDSYRQETVGDGTTVSSEEDVIGGNDELRPKVVLKKNGRELDFSAFINNLMNLSAKIKKAVEDIQNLVPTIGWKVTLDLKVMEGSITGKWGVQNGEDMDPSTGVSRYAYGAARYVAVRRYYGFEFKAVIFGATLTLMVGVEVKVNAVFWQAGELVVKIEGKLSGEAPLRWTVTSDQEVAAPTVGCDLLFSLSGTCRANVAGRHLVDADASLRGGFKFTATPRIDHKALSMPGRLERLKTSLTYYGCSGGVRPDPVVVDLYDGDVIYNGDLLGGRREATPAP